MENFLPALLIIGGVIYKIYSEYQKEQEKMRKRRPHIPTAEPVAVPIPPPTAKRPIPPTFQKEHPSMVSKKVEQPVKQRYDIPEEVNRVREQRQHRKIETVDLEHQQKNKVPEFNLRDAVIQAAILERPYK
ncbi:hypothetical protein E2P86_14585 [Sphingobacterium psychroaquaticum]|uniref:hypothetical protein n=1 Tax=Sphingobacterium psychroaquaticum TaxID=561061 RepID=UPI00106BF54C|nr:hypothetical protein [Sphingobacterium psychroaquaticum]QBQ42306.1 hypothetical protein E2P86_14585 [Sphingobacterium psychroaquaticum]